MQFNPFNPKTYHVLSYLDRIKLLMLMAMTIGHLAWAFVPTDTILSDILHFIARPTIVLACFLVAEGFRLTRDINGYAKRLFGFGVLAQVPFVMAMMGIWRIVYEPIWVLAVGNVLFTLGLCLVSLILCKKIEKTPNVAFKGFYVLLIVFLMVLSDLFMLDWGYMAMAWTIAIYYKRLWGFVAVTLFIATLSLVADVKFIDDMFQGAMDFGLALAIPIIYWYDKNKHRSPTTYRLPRTLFYWYYVGHLSILACLVQFTPYAVDEYGVLMDRQGNFINEPKTPLE